MEFSWSVCYWPYTVYLVFVFCLLAILFCYMILIGFQLCFPRYVKRKIKRIFLLNFTTGQPNVSTWLMWYVLHGTCFSWERFLAWPAQVTMDPSSTNGCRLLHQAQEHSCQASWMKNSAPSRSLVFSVNMAPTSPMINPKRAEKLWIRARRSLLMLSVTHFKRVSPWSQICSVLIINQTPMVVWRSAGLREQVSASQKLILLELVHPQLFVLLCQFHLV